MRRPGLACALAASVAVGLVPAVAQAKTIKVDWREQVTVSGGAIKFRVTKIVATPRTWSVTASIHNATGSRLGLEPKGRSFGLPPSRPVWANGLALIEPHRVYTEGIGGHHFEWWQHPAATFRPRVPAALPPRGTWSGTFGGRSKLRKGQALSIGFGLFLPEGPESGGRTVYWITDHSFTL